MSTTPARDDRFSRIAITRSVDVELAVGAALHTHPASSERGDDRPANGELGDATAGGDESCSCRATGTPSAADRPRVGLHGSRPEQRRGQRRVRNPIRDAGTAGI